MNTASLPLCRELYDLSGWDSTWFRWYEDGDHIELSDGSGMGGVDYISAYDLGYLLRKLPSHTAIIKLDFVYMATHDEPSNLDDADLANQILANTPEDAAAKLAIELFKSGVLTR